MFQKRQSRWTMLKSSCVRRSCTKALAGKPDAARLHQEPHDKQNAAFCFCVFVGMHADCSVRLPLACGGLAQALLLHCLPAQQQAQVLGCPQPQASAQHTRCHLQQQHAPCCCCARGCRQQGMQLQLLPQQPAQQARGGAAAAAG